MDLKLIQCRFYKGIFQIGVFANAMTMTFMVFSRMSMWIGGHIYTDIGNLYYNCAVFKFVEVAGSCLNNFTCANIAFGYLMIRRALTKLEIVELKPIYIFCVCTYTFAIALFCAIFGLIDFFFYNESYCLADSVVVPTQLSSLIETTEVLPFLITFVCYVIGAIFYNKNLFATEESKLGVEKEDFTKRYNVMFFWLSFNFLITNFAFIFVLFYQNAHDSETFELLDKFFVLIGITNLQTPLDCIVYYKYLLSNVSTQQLKEKQSASTKKSKSASSHSNENDQL